MPAERVKSVFKIVGDFVNDTLDYLFAQRVSAVIPAYNEEETIARVIKETKKVFEISETIVVDDGSTDKTAEIAEKAGAKVIRHEKNQGKGAAISTGIKNAKENIVLFLDADLKNIDKNKIKELIRPVLANEADSVKASFSRESGRVTELTVKPLLKHFFPHIDFKQPLSGQFCARKEVLKGLKIEKQWGVDIGILIDVASRNYRIKEVDIGEVEHVSRSLEELKPMAHQVAKTILEKAGVKRKKYPLIVFDLDNTLLEGRNIDVIAKKFGFSKQLEAIRKKFAENKIAEHEASAEIAKMFSGKKASELLEAVKEMKFRENAIEVIKKLREQHKIAIISMAYSPVCSFFAEKLGVEYYCPELEEENNVLTGKVVFPEKWMNGCKKHKICKLSMAKSLAKENRLALRNMAAIGDSKGDACILENVGLGIAINPDKEAEKSADIKIKNLAEVLLYIE